MPDFTSSPDALLVGRRVRQLRKARGWTLGDLAGRVERTPSTLSMLENGRREPKLSLLQSLAEAFEVTVADLLGTQELDRRAGVEGGLQRVPAGGAFRSLRPPAGRPGAPRPPPVRGA